MAREFAGSPDARPSALAGGGLRARRLRSILSAAGIALGIAAMVAVLGISASSRTNLLAELDALGTNLLTVEAGQTLIGGEAKLPETAPGMIGRIGPVESTAATARVSTTVRRTDRISAVGDRRHRRAGRPAGPGRDPARHPVGRAVPRRRHRPLPHRRPRLGGRRAARHRPGRRAGVARRPVVHGHRDPRLRAAGAGDRPVRPHRLPGGGVARSAPTASPGTVYLRTDPAQVDAVRSVLAPTTNPQHPEEVKVSRPSDALAARDAADTAFTGLLLGLGAVALIVGGVGVANVMVVSVLERRPEIGLRRALGATRGDVRRQFLAESLLLSGAGGLGGVAIGAAITAVYAAGRSWGVAVPVPALAGAMGAALLIGAVAGLYPALRAARLAPTDALRT